MPPHYDLINCVDCAVSFDFTPERPFFEAHGWRRPVRCIECRRERRERRAEHEALHPSRPRNGHRHSGDANL